ncbi:Ypar14, super integron cassette [Pseudoalteromonas luteoviolacea]|uniref:Ypar14, super integron cassette n=1 Tax=Pseudoalteromonas luteoviolacea TaxID=43657 RepID=UPI001F29E6A9|nr:Ypar14, super integron cassette [Pseudoalteromonas luteoviolacea]MCF6441877.1 Ypar14, super integron cassette [Pseudoalteromonas luteoviolacea]
MLNWDETDVLATLEVLPEIESDGIWHKYAVKKQGIELVVFIYQYDGDVRIELKTELLDKSVFSMHIMDCPSIVRKLDSTGEYLEFAAPNIVESHHGEPESIRYGARVYVTPSINVPLF